MAQLRARSAGVRVEARAASRGVLSGTLSTGLGAPRIRRRPKRHGVEVVRDLPYQVGRGSHAEFHRLDVYKPIGRPGPWPVVFYVHGGGFHLLSKDTHWLMGLVFARFGYLVVNICVPARADAPVSRGDRGHVRLAYRWLAKNIEELGGDLDARRGRGRVGRRQPDHRARPRDDPAPPRAVGARPFDTRLVPRAALPFCALLEVSRPERFAERRPLPRWIDGMIRDASASYLQRDDHGATIELADPLRALEDAAGGRDSIARCRRSSRRSARAIRCSTTRAGSRRRSTPSTCRAKRSTTRAGSMPSTRWCGIPPRAGVLARCARVLGSPPAPRRARASR